MKRLLAPRKLFRDVGVLTFAFALALLGSIAYAQWQEPTAPPPGNNVPAPINVGSDAQDKAGPLGVGALAVFGDTSITGGYLDFEFINTSVGDQTSWRVAGNDGAGNFLQYWNTRGGLGPTFDTDGHAFRQSYYPGDGVYHFWTSGAGGGNAGDSISWIPAMQIRPNGDVAVRRICAIGGDCYNVADLDDGSDGADGADGVDASDFPVGSHCGLWSDMSPDFNVDCLGYSPEVECPAGFRQFYRDFQSPGNRHYATCVRSEDPYWRYGAWQVTGTTACTPSCMGGTVTTETSVAECYDPAANSVVSDSQCSTAKPADRTRNSGATYCYDISCGP